MFSSVFNLFFMFLHFVNDFFNKPRRHALSKIVKCRNMKKLIGYNYALEHKMMMYKARRGEILEEVKAEFLKFNLPYNESEIKQIGTLQSFINQFEKKNGNKYPEHFTITEKINAAKINLNTLQALQKEYNKHLGSETDFNIYATTPEELKRYEVAANLLKSVKEFLAQNPELNKTVVYSEIKKLTNGALNRIPNTHEYEVNYSGYVFIKNNN